MIKIRNDRIKPSYFLLMPAVIAVGYLPLLVHSFEYNTGLTVFDWFPNNTATATDFFLGWKAVGIVLTALLAAVLLYAGKQEGHRGVRFENAFYILLFYMLFVAMSALFSPYMRWVVSGTYEFLEPVWVLFAYGFLCFYTYHTVRNEQQLDVLFKFIGPGVAVGLLIGCTQAAGCSFFETTIGKMLITSPSYWNDLKGLVFGLGQKVYITLYNPNYVPFYTGMILPVCIALFINSRKWSARICLAVLTIGAVICLIGSGTTTGWMAVLIAVLISGLVLLSRNKKKFMIGVLLLAITGSAAFAAIGQTTIGSSLKDVIAGTYKADTAFGIKSIETGKDICINYKGATAHFTYEGDRNTGSLFVAAVDENGTPLQQSLTENGEYSFLDQNGSRFIVEPSFLDEKVALSITIEEHSWIFLRQDDGIYQYYNAAGKCVEFPAIKHVQWFNEDAFSGRGHIWNKTIPVLPKHILLGSGANTYLLEIPQEDYLFKNYTDTNNYFDVKAHNWFLQQWVENGLSGTICLIAFYMCYFVSSIRLFRKISFRENIHRISFALFVGLLIYMISALANDPTVNVSTLYWVGLGLGMSVNRMIAEENKKEIL